MNVISARDALGALLWLPVLSPNRKSLFSAVMQRGVKPESMKALLGEDALLLSALMDADNPCESAGGRIEACGIGKLRRLALGLRFKQPAAHAITWSAERFLRQSSVTAGCVESVSQTLKSEHPGLAHFAGLFHDIGEALMAVSMPKVYDDIQAVARITNREISGIESELLGCDHARLSAMVLRGWNLPEAMCDSVEFHHRPESAPESARQLALLLFEADRYFTSKSMACMAVGSLSLDNLSVTTTCMTYSPGASFAPSES